MPEAISKKENMREFFTKLDNFFISLYEGKCQEMTMIGAQLRRLEERVARLEEKHTQE